MRCKARLMLKITATLVLSTICVHMTVYYLSGRRPTQISPNRLYEVASGMDEFVWLSPVRVWKAFLFQDYNGSVDGEWKRALELSNGKDSERVHRLPDVIGIGIQKCGTGALQHFLSHHPYVRALRGEGKFFNKPDNRAKGLEYYREMLPAALPHELIIEKTPAYFSVKGLPTYLRQILAKDAKIILLLCNPVSRALSDFVMKVERFGGKIEPFDHFVVRNTGDDEPDIILRRGIYHAHLRSWMRSFGSNLLILNGELLLKDPATLLKTVQKFLNIPVLITETNFIKNSTTGLFCFRHSSEKRREAECEDSSRKGITRSKTAQYTLSDRSSKILRSFYHNHNKKLYKILRRNFGW